MAVITPTRSIRLGLVVLMLAVAACGSSSPAKSASTTTAAASGATTTTGAASSSPASASARIPSSPTIGHVFVINLENKTESESWGPTSVATYLNHTLRPQGQLLPNYYGIGHVSLDNYIAEISGQAPNPSTSGDCPIFVEFSQTGTGPDGQALGKGCVYPTSVKTVADELTAAGYTWKAYQEDIGNDPAEPTTCRHPKIGTGDDTLVARKGDEYATRHDPFVYFHSIIDDTAACAKEVVGLSQLTTDLASASTTPNLSFITPNLCDDGHDAPCVDQKPGGLLSADAWLQTWAPKILASPAFKKDGLLVITFDEAEVGGPLNSATACCHTPTSPNSPEPGLTGPGGGQVGTLLISPLIKAGTTNPTPYNHYALLCSIENAFGLSHLGFAGAPGLTCFGKDVYDAASTPST